MHAIEATSVLLNATVQRTRSESVLEGGWEDRRRCFNPQK